LPPRLVVLASHQEAGRGRLGRRWHSSPGGGVYFSLVERMTGPEDMSSLPLLVGVALSRTICDLTRQQCRLKWPNDLMVAGRKIGGILIECVSRGPVSSVAVIGVGVNYRESPELSSMGGIALREVVTDLPSLEKLAYELVQGVEQELRHLGDLEYATSRYSESSAHRQGDTVRFRTDKGLQSGTFDGFDGRGFLILQSAEGEVRVAAGEAVEDWTRRES
jgi:BirA family biotin operon repressor/biotin-[acetyl-CoA-carboxylase] ligase